MKTVFFDIDGTLWDFMSVIPESTSLAIKLLKKKGHKVFINTGRTRGYVTDTKLLSLPFDGIISGCGTRIEYGGHVAAEHLLSDKLAFYAVDRVREYGVRAILEGPEYLYMDYEDFKDDPYGRKVMRDLGENLKPLSSNYGKWKISKLSCDMTGCDKDGFYDKLRQDFQIIEHNETIAEFVPSGFSKGTGIEKLCELLGLDIKDTIAVGDGENDAEMFKKAGFSVAMGSGSRRAQAMADYVTSGLKEDGVFNAMLHLGLID